MTVSVRPGIARSYELGASKVVSIPHDLNKRRRLQASILFV